MKTIIISLLISLSSLTTYSMNAQGERSNEFNQGSAEKSEKGQHTSTGSAESAPTEEKSTEVEITNNMISGNTLKNHTAKFSTSAIKSSQSKKNKLFPETSFFHHIFGNTGEVIMTVLAVLAVTSLLLGAAYFVILFYSAFQIYFLVGLGIIALGVGVYLLVERASQSNGGKGQKFLAVLEAIGTGLAEFFTAFCFALV